MKRIFQILLVLSMLGSNIVLAQSGAAVYRDQELNWWTYYDGVELLSVHSSDMDFYCGEGDPTDFYMSDWLAVVRPDGSVKFKTKGHYFTRVFYPVNPDDFYGDGGMEDYCESVNSYDYLIAEGIAHHVFNDNAFFWGPLHKGRNTFGHTWSGTLTDLTGTCEKGMVDFTLLIKWQLKKDAPACEPDCWMLRKWKGPELECTE